MKILKQLYIFLLLINVSNTWTMEKNKGKEKSDRNDKKLVIVDKESNKKRKAQKAKMQHRDEENEENDIEMQVPKKIVFTEERPMKIAFTEEQLERIAIAAANAYGLGEVIEHDPELKKNLINKIKNQTSKDLPEYLSKLAFAQSEEETAEALRRIGPVIGLWSSRCYEDQEFAIKDAQHVFGETAGFSAMVVGCCWVIYFTLFMPFYLNSCVFNH